MKFKLNPLTGEFDYTSESANKQKLNPLTGEFNLVEGDGPFSQIFNPLNGKFNLGTRGGGGIIAEVTGNGYINLTNAVANHLMELKAYGGTEQKNLPSGYTELNWITNANNGYIDTDIKADVDDMEFDIIATISSTSIISWYILQSRASGSSPIYGIFGSVNGNTIIGSFSGTNITVPNVQRTDGHTYHVNFVCKNGTSTITVEDLTDNTTSTNTGTYTFSAASTNIGLFNNMGGGGSVPSGNTYIKSAYIKKSGVKVFDYIACTYNNANGFYDTVSESFKGATAGTFTAGPNAAPTPSQPMDIVSNNGVLKFSKNMANVNAQTALVGYYISAAGVVTASPQNWIYQDYIPVKPNTTYTLTMSSSIYFVSISEYSTANDSGFIVRNASGSGARTQYTITTGANTHFVRFGANLSSSNITIDDVLAIDWQLEIGDTPIPYHEYVEGGVYVDGTVETISNRINLFDINKVTDGYYYTTQGGYDTAAAVRLTDFIPVQAGETYVFKYIAVGGPNVRLNYFDTNKTWLNQVITSSASGTYSYNITPSQDGYVRISANRPNVGSQSYIDWDNTVIETYGDTATAEMLLKVGDYQDEQEILSGNITRKVGVKVLDGTENWETTSTTNLYLLRGVEDVMLPSISICTHYLGVETTVAGVNMPDLSVRYGVTGYKNRLYIKDTTVGNLAELKQYLASQYAAGTPVIIVYPLATPTTESVAGQTMNIQAGDNTIEITQASIDNLGLYAKYLQSN